MYLYQQAGNGDHVHGGGAMKWRRKEMPWTYGRHSHNGEMFGHIFVVEAGILGFEKGE